MFYWSYTSLVVHFWPPPILILATPMPRSATQEGGASEIQFCDIHKSDHIRTVTHLGKRHILFASPLKETGHQLPLFLSSVCLSNTGVVSKRLYVSSNFSTI